MRLKVLSLIFLTVILSSYKTLGFYFWHDDFSWFYMLRNNNCFSFWPYNTFCNFLNFLYQTFGYQPIYYYITGIVLLFSCSVFLFFICRKFFNNITSLLLACFFSTLFIGTGAFLEVHSPLLVFTPLFLLLTSMLLFSKSQSRPKFSYAVFSIGVLVFALSVLIIPIRTSTHVLPAIAFIFLFLDKISFRKKIVLSIVIFFTYYLSFFVFPPGVERKFLSSGDIQSLSSSFDIFRKTDFFLKTFGSFILPDWVNFSRADLIRQVLAIIVLSLIAARIVKNRGKLEGKVGFFALVWIASFYFPYSLRSDFRLLSTHRYLLSLFPGVIFALGIFSKSKYWKAGVIILIFIGIIQSNLFFAGHLNQSSKRSNFYIQLHNSLSSMPAKSVLFFDSKPEVRNEMADYFRVGFHPSEASLGAEFQVNHENLKLILDSKSLSNYLKINSEIKNLFTFYYDGDSISNTTKDSRQILSSTSSSYSSIINKAQKTKTWFDEKIKQWSGANEEIAFKIEKFRPILPSTIFLEIEAKPLPIPLPYTQGCIDCRYDHDTYQKSLEYITSSRSLKRNLKIEVSNSAEETRASSLNDDDPRTYWLADRQAWFKNTKPVITLSLNKGENIEGVIISSDFPDRKPKEFKVTVDGSEKKYTLKKAGEGKIALILKEVESEKQIAIEVTSTSGKDAPGITELDPIPSGFSNVDFELAYKTALSPVSIIKTKEEVDTLSGYLSSGASACIKWEQVGYGKGEENISYLLLDGKTRVYSIELPVFGTEVPTFKLGCLDYPVDLKLYSANIKFNQ